MTDTLIARIGRALWGEYWKAGMAHALDINKSSAQRFGDGTYSLPDGLMDDLRELRPMLVERRVEIDKLLKELP